MIEVNVREMEELLLKVEQKMWAGWLADAASDEVKKMKLLASGLKKQAYFL